MTSAARNTPNTMTVNGRSHRHSDHCGAGAAGALGKRGLDGMDRRASEKCLISGTRARSRLDERRVTMIDLTRRDVVRAAGGKMGRGSCGERVGTYGEISVVAVLLKKTQYNPQ